MTKELFPAPSISSSALSPRPLAGVSHGSTEKLREVLKDNHERWHVLFNDALGFHNHSAHYVLALWALGADQETIQAAYDKDSKYQLPAYASPGEITTENFKDHLGKPEYYQAYRKFFTDVVQDKDTATVLEEFIFDPKMNHDGSANGPEMLNRFLDGLIHPLIHFGYGAEFALPGMVVEGLALTAIHTKPATVLFPPSLWEPKTSFDTLTTKLSSALEDKPSQNTHALSILARVLKNPRFEGVGQEEIRAYYNKFLSQHGEALRKITDEWSYDQSDPKEVERKIEELVLLNVLIYGVGGWKKDEDFNADFIHMHLVTSSLFLSSITAHLKPASQEIFLRAYLTFSLAIWLINGYPKFDIPAFFAADTAYPIPAGPLPAAQKNALPSETSPKSTTPNPWFPIIQNALTIVDDHLPKTQRALQHFAVLYGARPAGYLKGSTELPGAESIDGSLFVRVAGLTDKRVVQRLNTVEHPGGPAFVWDR